MAKTQDLKDIMRSINQGDLTASVDGMHPWRYAIENKSLELAKCLIDNGRINEVFNYYPGYNMPYSPLILACKK